MPQPGAFGNGFSVRVAPPITSARLQHQDVQAGAGQQDGGDQAVVPGTDDHDVGAGRNLTAHAAAA